MSKKRSELYRNPSKGKIAGVCAGIADYFGWEIWLVRILVVSGVLFGMPFLIFIYIAGWFILDKAPNNPHKMEQGGFESSRYQQRSNNDDISHETIKVKGRVWQSGEPPQQAFYDISRKFKQLERKLQVMEQYVTSPEFTVSREINKL
ncbi:envelope stress response membrane protein PspC [Colwellia asteriadis]|uniref:Envelope stress response membrane protein PspC n=1 Tax=Colwellia asteriadis TaxID=517723 RepID=A0ABP3WFU2_9GAMM